MEKLCKMARRIDIALKALQIILVAFTVILALATLFAKDDVMWTFNLNNATRYLSQPVGWLMFLVSEGVALYGLHIFRRILQPMKQGQPFAETVSADMRRLGWLVLIAGGALSLIGLFNEQTITTPNDTFMVRTRQLDVTFLGVAAMLFLFSYIFRYGEELQRLSDETL